MKKQKDLYQVALKLLLENTKGETLILKADPKGSLAGFYDLPGGRIDFDEFNTPFAQIIQREIKEEVGEVKFEYNPLRLTYGRHLVPAHLNSTGQDVHVLVLIFPAKYLGGKVQISEEHIGFKWVKLTKDNLPKYFTKAILEAMKLYFNK